MAARQCVALAIGRGRGVAATMHTERTAATERMGESLRRLAVRACAGDGGAALGGRQAVGRAAATPRGGRYAER